MAVESSEQNHFFQSQELMQTALAAARMVAWQWNIADDRITFSENAAEVLRLPDDFSRQRRSQWLALVHPDDVERHRAIVDESVEHGGRYDSHFRLIRPSDGSVLWVEEQGEAQRDDSRKTIRLTGVIRNITERKLAEQELQQERDLLGVTLDSIGDAVITTDAEGRVTLLNPVAETLTGWSRSDALGQPLTAVFSIINAKTRQPVENPVEKVLREGVIVGLANHTVLISRDGSECPIDDSASPIRDDAGTIIGVVLIFRDVTEQRESQRQVRESERRYRLISEAANDAIWDWELVTNQVTWNEGVQTRFGYTAEQVGPEANWWVEHIHPDDRERVVHGIHEAIEGGQERWSAEYRFLRANGDSAFVFDRGRVVHDENGRPIRMVGSMLDLTERMRTEQALRESEERFRAAVSVVSSLIWTNNAEGQMEGEQPGWGNFTGQSEDEYQGYGWANVVHPEDAQPTIEAWNQAVAEKRLFEFEHRVRRRDGQWRECSIRAVPVVNGEGEIREWVGVHTDVTDRKQAEAALRDSEERYRTLFESIDEGFCIVEMMFDDAGQPIDYRFLEINRVFAQNTGLQDAAGKTARELAPELEPHWFEIYGRVATTGEPVRFINESPTLGRWFDVFASRIGEPEARQVAILFSDITERKRAESEQKRLLKEIETERERLIDVFQRAPSFMCVLTGPNHVFERANDRYYQVVGHRKLLGLPAREALPEVEGQGLFELLDGVYQTGEPFVGTDMSVLLQRQPGDPPEERYLDFVYQALRGPDDTVTGILVQGIDLTDRKLAEAALRENEQRFRTLVEQVQDYAIFMTDVDGRATTWNEGVRQVLGFEESEFLGQDIVSTIFTPEDVKAGVPQRELDEAATNGSTGNDRWMQRMDGTRFFANGITSALHDESDRLIGFMKVMRDQTKQRHLEDNLRQVAADLSEANRRKTEFLATLGHELRNPLAPIRTGLEVMKLSMGDPVAMEETRSMMERQTRQMVRLIDDLLDVSRITQGKMTLQTCRVALNDVMQSAVEAARPFIDEANHELTVTMPSQTIHLSADPNRLAQVFSNLLNNATKYTPEGGCLELTAHHQDHQVCVTVKDNGIGIPMELQAGIFEMFSQIDQPLEKGYRGLGIGLTLVKRLVEMHNGRIEIRSAGADQGSEFTVRLPILTDSPAEKPESPVDRSVAEKSKLRVLIVDDNQAAADMLTVVVKMLGNEVQTAYDGSQAVRSAQTFRPHVVLMDIGMPVMNGYEAAQHIRTHEWGSDMILVALTGWGQDEDRQRTENAGFDHHFVKPAEPDSLQKLFAELADRI
ncbi:PAS domain S-box protein [Thalassoroseus pseudoceratinae]|uniref:PAS domain S-box protein n=1 Tax=Thalassoroseus pseudoceratinae TaxID=2713176 RepID=UPI00141F89E0|nr:PAS domain S-box protein [Thalassoroseus pseudoceratinae]